MNSMTWTEKYRIVLQEFMTSKDIAALRGCNITDAHKIRNQALEYCYHNDLAPLGNKVPTEAVMAVTGKDEQFYWEKAEKERKLEALCYGY